MTPFQKNLAFGQIAETEIARWLKRRGNLILPVYDIEYETGKGPRLFGARNMVAPDLLVFSAEQRIYWAECKRKTVFSWHRKTARWVTGIDLTHWNDYCRVFDSTKVPVWIFFLHESCTPRREDIHAGSPLQCPTGLFGQSIQYLREHINHQCSGMVYWAHEALKLLR